MAITKKIDEALMQALTVSLSDEIEKTKELVRHLVDESTFVGIVTEIFKRGSHRVVDSLGEQFWDMGIEKEGKKALHDLYLLGLLIEECKPFVGDRLEVYADGSRGYAILKEGESNVKLMRYIVFVEGENVVVTFTPRTNPVATLHSINPQNVLIVGQDASGLIQDTSGRPMLGCVSMSAEKAKEMQEQYSNAYGYGDE